MRMRTTARDVISIKLNGGSAATIIDQLQRFLIKSTVRIEINMAFGAFRIFIGKIFNVMI